MFENKISSFLCLVSISTIFLIFISPSSNPFTTIINPKQVHNVAEEKFACDLFAGRWVREPRGSVYTNSTCSMLPDMKNCAKYGKDQGYVYWKWKPDECELPRFDPTAFLRIVRGKNMAFVGDSLARNQMESLLCLLSQAESPSDIYNHPNDKFHTWHFASHNFTLIVIGTRFLVQATERIINKTASNAFDIHIDQPNPTWANKLPHLHYIVLSSGNWFFRKNYLHENGTLIGCVGCSRDENLTEFTIGFAMRRVFSTSLQFISRCEECDENNLVTLLRTFSPPHFEHGSWFTGGYCNRTEPLDENFEGGSSAWEKLRRIQLEELGKVKILKGRKKFEVLDVTKAMMVRADGHPGDNLNRKWMRSSVNDCLHWCLPGPVDMWNDLLLATLKKDSLL